MAAATTAEQLDAATELLASAYDFCTRFELTRAMVLTQAGKDTSAPVFPLRWYENTERFLATAQAIRA